MSVRLEVSSVAAAAPVLVWDVLTDWEGQRRWIPMTTVRVSSRHAAGLGVRVAALSGFWLGPLPLGLLDRFVVTGWTPPQPDRAGELEVLHLGPYFTGVGVFRLSDAGPGPDGRTTLIECTEVFDVVGGSVPTRLAGLGLPAMRRMFAGSLTALGALAAGDR